MHAYGAYHNIDNQQYCKDNQIDMLLYAIQDAKDRHQLNFQENVELSVFDIINNKITGNMIMHLTGTFYSFTVFFNGLSSNKSALVLSS